MFLCCQYKYVVISKINTYPIMKRLAILFFLISLCTLSRAQNALPRVSVSENGFRGPVKSVREYWVATTSYLEDNSDDRPYWIPDSICYLFSVYGNLVEERYRARYEAEVTYYVYDSLGRLEADTCKSSENGFHAHVYVCDSLGRISCVEEYFIETDDILTPVDTIRLDYDEAGRVAARHDSFGNTVRYYYDKHGRLEREVSSENCYDTYRYNKNGRKVVHVDCSWSTTLTYTLRYDKYGNIVKETIKDQDTQSGSKRSRDILKYRYTEYDKYGNWLKGSLTAKIGVDVYNFDIRREITYLF